MYAIDVNDTVNHKLFCVIEKKKLLQDLEEGKSVLTNIKSNGKPTWSCYFVFTGVL